MRKVEVEKFNDIWSDLFLLEAQKLEQLFGENMIEIHHIGSTAVKGLKAKPVIDIMPVVQDLSLVDQKNDEMKAIGYEAMGENGLEVAASSEKVGIYVHIMFIFMKEGIQISIVTSPFEII